MTPNKIKIKISYFTIANNSEVFLKSFKELETKESQNIKKGKKEAK